MKQYIDLLKDILENGIDTGDRTGNGRRKVFGRQLRFNVSDGTLPLSTTCQTPFKNVIKETLWFIKGSTSNKDLLKENVPIWDEWAVKEKDIDLFLEKYFDLSEEGSKAMYKAAYMEHGLEEIGNMYGRAWRDVPVSNYNQLFPDVEESDIAPDRLARIKETYENEKPVFEDNSPVPWKDYLKAIHYSSIDQLQNLILSLKNTPFSSRHVINAWIPEFIPFEKISPQENVLLGKGALAPCHVLQQYLVLPPAKEGGKNRISLMMTQRSTDTPIGLRFNLAQYALLLMMIAQVVDMEPFEFIWSGGDTHIYLNQIEKVREHVLREPLPLPKVRINPEVKSIYDFTINDFEIVDYTPYKNLGYPISI